MRGEGSQCGQWAAPRSRSCELKVGGILRDEVGREGVRLSRICRRCWCFAGNAIGSWDACLGHLWLHSHHTRYTALSDCGLCGAGDMSCCWCTIVFDCSSIACGRLRQWRQQIQCKLRHWQLAGTGLLSSCCCCCNLGILALGLLLIVRLFRRLRGGRPCGDDGLWRLCCRLHRQWRRQ